MRLSKNTLPFWVGLCLYAIYLLSFSGHLHVMDELAVFTAGHNLAQYQQADINPLIWTNHWTPHPPGIWGQDDNLYTKKAPGISVLAAPLIWLGHRLPSLNALHLALLTSVIITALTASLLLVWLRELNLPQPIALGTAFGFGLCTIAWVYARMFWGLTVLGLCFLIAVWAIRRGTESNPKLGWIFGSSLALALGLTLRFEAAAAAGLVGLYLLSHLWTMRPRHRAALPLLTFALPLMVSIIGLATFNLSRYGSLSETGYTQEILFSAPWVGSFGLLFSPGNGLFMFAPFMLILLVGLIPTWRALSHRYYSLIAAICLFYWVFYGAWFSWGGTWGWGPRFLLPTLPLMMLFVGHGLRLLWPHMWGKAIVISLALLSIGINLLGVLVDFNEHFLRLGRNDNFVFNWAAYPPLGHWYILQDGLVDVIWLAHPPTGWTIYGSVLLPGLLMLSLAMAGLIATLRLKTIPLWTPLTTLLIAISLTYLMMTAMARVTLMDEQSVHDMPLLATLSTETTPDMALLMPMPPFVDAQEISTLLMGYQHTPLPTYSWIESMPRAIQPEERERVWQAVHHQAQEVWLFERWLSQTDPLQPTAARLNQEGFIITEQWFEQSGRLSRYALSDSPPALTLPLNVPFTGGLTLHEATIWQTELSAGDTIKLRLRWQASPTTTLSTPIIGFAHLLPPQGGGALTQQDRLLFNPKQPTQAPLHAGESISQGYGLRLPDDTPPGNYPLIIGLYQAENGQRLLRADDSPDDFIYLTTMVVE